MKGFDIVQDFSLTSNNVRKYNTEQLILWMYNISDKSSK